jgi:hypothetical protein
LNPQPPVRALTLGTGSDWILKPMDVYPEKCAPDPKLMIAGDPASAWLGPAGFIRHGVGGGIGATVIVLLPPCDGNCAIL